MSDESFQEKSEKPTPKRREDARKKGQVPKSQEVTSAFLLLAGAGAIRYLTGDAATGIRDIFETSIGTFASRPEGIEGVVGMMRDLSLATVGVVAPFVLTLGGAALFVAGVQARGIMAPEALEPKWERLNPLKKAKEIWGPRAGMELLKNLLKLVIVGSVAWMVVGDSVPTLGALGQQGPASMMLVARSFVVRLLMSVGLAYLVIALIDYAWQIHSHEKSLKMTKEEIKKEHKESEGDQIMKVRRRSFGRQLARRRMLISVGEADVVITNPTHIAVALKYDPSVSDAPIVLAMGERKVAQKIKEIAKQHGVPTVENKPLARALYATATVGMAIPIDLFVAVAEVLAFVIRQRKSTPKWAGMATA